MVDFVIITESMLNKCRVFNVQMRFLKCRFGPYSFMSGIM